MFPLTTYMHHFDSSFNLTVLRASSDNSNASAKTEVLYGEEKTIEIMVQSFDRTMVGYDVCGNWAAPSFILGSDHLRNALMGLKKKEVLD
jgi:hypothetical protein